MPGKSTVIIILLFVFGAVLVAGCTTPTPGPNTTTPTVSPNVTAAPTTVTGATDLSNRNSPEVASFTTYPSNTRLHSPDVSVGLKRVAGNLTAPLHIADPKDGSGRLFVVDQTGYVKTFYTNGTIVDRPFLDVRGKMVNLSPTYDERGLLSIAFHPNFSTNGRVYAFYSAPLRAGVDPNWSCTNRLAEFTVNASDRSAVDNSTERILLEIDKPYQNHNGGILLFGPDDSYLYLTLGDGGRADDTGMGHTPGIGNAQDLTTMHGKIIRIDVNNPGSGRAYGIPSDNPFLSNASIPAEIYAYGFRNPAYATFDSGGSHRMFVAMAGQRLFESVLVVYRGGAYPWNIREGTHCFDPANNSRVPNTTCRITSYSGQPLIGPIVELGHDVGDTIVGGVVYRGTALASMQGAYFFGTWSDESRIVGNGTLLVATPPSELDTSTLPDDGANLTAAQNSMWTTRLVTVVNNANGRINAFIRGLYESTDHEVLVLINQNGGPGLTPQNSGEIWMMVPAGTGGLVAIGNASTPAGSTGTVTGAATATGTTGTPGSPMVTATATTTGTQTTGGAAGQPTTIALTAQNNRFDKTTITAPAGSTVTMTFVNDDRGVPHNVALYTDSSASTSIYRGAVVTGPSTTTYTFTAPGTAGTYFFRCDIHPETMTGSFIVT